MSLPTTGWSNKVGTSNRSCACGTWKQHWMNFSNRAWPIKCSLLGCENAPTLGAHLINTSSNDEYIVPFCDSCNKIATYFTIEEGSILIRANPSMTCIKKTNYQVDANILIKEPDSKVVLWPRNLYAGVGGGMYRGIGGGLYTGIGGGAYTGIGGGLYAGLGGPMYTGLGGGLYQGLGGGLYQGLGGGLYQGLGGVLYAGLGGGLYAGLGGGLYAGLDSNPYMSRLPPWPHFLRELDNRGFVMQAKLIRRYLPKIYWPENFFSG
jgi:hypothetical protein